jgi:fused signal recognition particle receptor
VLLVLDATTGQNGLSQAREFTAVAGVTGIVLTKLDGTARGGIVVPIMRELNLPVRFVGTGESADDLVPFDAQAFVEWAFRLGLMARQTCLLGQAPGRTFGWPVP